MKLTLEKNQETREIKLEKAISIQELLKKENIPIESVLLSKNGELVLEDELIEDKDELLLLSVVSGG